MYEHALLPNFMIPAPMCVDFLFCWATGNRPLCCLVFTIHGTALYSALEIIVVPAGREPLLNTNSVAN